MATTSATDEQDLREYTKYQIQLCYSSTVGKIAVGKIAVGKIALPIGTI